MKLNIFLVIAAILYGVFGIGMVLIPGQVFTPQGITLNDGGQLLARTFGAALIGFAVIFWQARRSENSSALRPILLGNAIYILIEVIVLVLGVLSGVGNALAWPGIVIDLLLLVGFGYFYFQLARPSIAQ